MISSEQFEKLLIEVRNHFKLEFNNDGGKKYYESIENRFPEFNSLATIGSYIHTDIKRISVNWRNELECVSDIICTANKVLFILF